MNADLYPYLMEPVYQDYLWGGDRLARLYGRKEVPDVCAESWEVSDRPEGLSIVAQGPCQGLSLHEMVTRYGKDLVGADYQSDIFPLLVKIIDARQRLSLQVHPDNASARLTSGEPKSEMWYILQADPGARVFCGLRPGVSRANFEDALRRQDLEPLLHAVPAVPGEAINVPGGRVHAIAEGCLLLEVQQNSNTTYRVYDWGRVDKNGHPRALHIEQALKVIRWNDPTENSHAPQLVEGPWLNECQRVLFTPYFKITEWNVTQSETFALEGDTFHAVFAAEGEVAVRGNKQDVVLPAGRTCLIPAGLDAYTVVPETPSATLIRITR